ncbi:MAG: hypothetical protein K2K87_08945, partial [Lachnospiraceae bacterium]|nr:hypothetical protein [Lachnospiraceae bacterium]
AVQYMARMLAIPLRAAGSAAGISGVGSGGFYTARTWYYLFQYGGLLLLGAVGATNLPVFLAKKLKFHGKNWNSAIFIAILLLLSIAWLVDASYNPFLYFRF